MKVLKSEKSVFSIQKLDVPDSKYIEQYYGQYVAVTVQGTSHKIIAKVGLCQHRNLSNFCYIDDSVLVFSPPLKGQKLKKEICEINDDVLIVLPSVQVATFVKVTLVFCDIYDIKSVAKNLSLLKDSIKNVLKLFVFSKQSIIFLDNLSKRQRLNLHCIIVNDIVCKKTNIAAISKNVNNIYRVNSSTEIVLEKLSSQLAFEYDQESPNKFQLAGCDKVWEILTGKMKGFLTQRNFGSLTKNILLIGPPGSGKTSVAHQLARHHNLIILEVLTADIYSSTPGETEKKLRQIFEKAKLHAENNEKSMILMDEIDSICYKTDDNSFAHSKRIIRQLRLLLKDIENTFGVVVIATSNGSEKIDPQLRRPGYFDDEVEIPIPSQRERESILLNIMAHHKLKCPDHIVNKVAIWTPGFVGADLQLITKETMHLLNCHKIVTDEIVEECFQKAVSKTMPVSLKGTACLNRSKDITFSEIGGLEELKKSLNCWIIHQLLYPERFRHLGIPPTKGVLLYGPPGCAKTTIVRALAKESNSTFLATSAADLYSPFVGDAEKSVIQLFSQARIGAPSIIFIDEIDALVGSKSGDRSRGVQERVLSALLVEMDGVGLRVDVCHSSRKMAEGEVSEQPKATANDRRENNNGVLVIGATNRPDKLDQALLRPGRFDKLVHVPAPNEDERLRILVKVTESMPLHQDVDLRRIAEATDCFSGADLKNLSNEAGLDALTSGGMHVALVRQQNFQNVLSKHTPSLDQKTINFYQDYCPRQL